MLSYRNFNFSMYNPNNRSSYFIKGFPCIHNNSTIRCKQNQVGQYFQEGGLIYLPEDTLGLQLIGGSHMKNAKTNNKPHHTLQFRSNIKLAAAASLLSKWLFCTLIFRHRFSVFPSLLQN